MATQRTRTDQEMLDLILRIAQEEDRIRAVILNGSRTDPRTPGDLFQDFDILYIVTELESFIPDASWPGRFGDLAILQRPDDMDITGAGRRPAVPRKSYAWLMQFRDGRRIDLTAVLADDRERLLRDSLRVLLLDKDGLFPPFPTPDDRAYHVPAPTAKQFDDCCNEFLWVSPYVAKGLWRGETVYVRETLEQLVRPQLLRMLSWHAGMRHGYAVSIGSYHKKLESLLDPSLRRMLGRTWPDARPEQVWDALLTMGRLFRRAAGEVAASAGFTYPEEDHRRVTALLRRIRHLPRDAERIY
ncbi:MAG: aminoglycoside 6-adenylyltransferase [Clostridia bacterium]|nr:aminoglycoside 6-adenylyltransferase [Clostridia bacterium]